MNVLSLFDGISCARVALDRAGIKVGVYYGAEIDLYAIEISAKNYPDIIRLSDVTHVGGEWHEGIHQVPQCSIDLLIGGSPCQDLSVAKGGRLGLAGKRSGLFYQYVRIMKETKPKWFVLENVASMSKQSKNDITKLMGVEPIMIDAALVSGQSRKRLFWTNIPGVTQPEDRNISLQSVLIDGYAKDQKAKTITASYRKGAYPGNMFTHRERTMIFKKPIQIGIVEGTKGGQACRIYSIEGKSVALKALGGGQGAKTGLYAIPLDGSEPQEVLVRDLYPVECERLQSLPDGYTDGVSKSQRIKTLGNAFNVDVVAHILSFIPKN